MRIESILAAIAFVGCFVSAAYAQDDAALLRDGLFARDRDVAVQDRSKPEYAPLPILAGSFIVRPELASLFEWTDNVFATRALAASDEIVAVEPSISATSDWPRNAMSAFARAGTSLYFDHSGEDTTDYAAGAAWRLDIERDLGVAAGSGFERDTEPRTAEGSPSLSAHPVQYDVAKAWIEGTKAFVRLRLTARGSVEDFTYSNASTLSGAPIYQKDQDRTTSAGVFKAEYAYTPSLSFAASLTFNKRAYRNALPGEAARTSRGCEASFGADFDLTHFARGTVDVGYLEQDYASRARFGPIRGLALRGRVEYFPTQLTTITVEATRSVEDSGIVDVDGYLASRVSLTLDHELLRNLVLTAAASRSNDRYRNYDRDDAVDREQIGATYLMNRAIALSFTCGRLSQDSRGRYAGPKYIVGNTTLSLTYRI